MAAPSENDWLEISNWWELFNFRSSENLTQFICTRLDVKEVGGERKAINRGILFFFLFA